MSSMPTSAGPAVRIRFSVDFYGPPANPQTYFDAFLPIEKVKSCRGTPGARRRPCPVHDQRLGRRSRGHPACARLPATDARRRLIRHAAGDGIRAPLRIARPGRHPRGSGDPGRPCARTLRATRGTRRSTACWTECLEPTPMRARFPAIREEARQVFERLQRAPAKPTVARPPAGASAGRSDAHARSRRRGDPLPVLLVRRGVSRAALPARGVSSGDFSPIASFLIRWRVRGTFDGLYLSITCAEDVPFVGAGAAERDDPTFLGGYRVRQQRAACEAWPRGTKPDSSDRPGQVGVCPSCSLRAPRSRHAARERRHVLAPHAEPESARARALRRPFTLSD